MADVTYQIEEFKREFHKIHRKKIVEWWEPITDHYQSEDQVWEAKYRMWERNPGNQYRVIKHVTTVMRERSPK